MEINRLSDVVKSWLYEAGEMVLEALNAPLKADEKSSRKDIVTNVDKEIEQFFVSKIIEQFPEDRIIGEEGASRNHDNDTQRTWLIDPIDGTLNFYKQKDYFCLMIAIEQEQGDSLGFIYELMRDEMLWGGPKVGVYLNDKRVSMVVDQPLRDGLININSGMVINNRYNAQQIIKQSLGIRMVGCAGIAIKEVVLGKQVAYMSYLQPWDYAAGRILAESVGIVVAAIDEEQLTLTKRQVVVFATPATYQEIRKIKEL
ncbi:inositol monophosphatase family protein [Vagococcus xieshaowenii]|uniref:Inositol monophosphatase family protein n=1 Tax=Vagococcus xieshaowenii TaxID=2562451 RepID=A0AAJ5JQ98_9ENTE|nr:inositol monophosphatase family protein [Vagococcus xieshaowenii]QCA28086.1 inositol monophosphatase family protein [Vagococcus xieshaowenii]TFZ40129.1 inositol monophosphatase family protein [Vagococcus xieshaowenii]